MHFRTSVSFDGVTGLSVRDQLSTTLGGNMRGQKMLNEMYKNGFTAKAVLQYTGNLSDELEKRYAKKIEEYITGKVDTIKNLVPIPAGSTIQPLNMKLADNQFIELKNTRRCRSPPPLESNRIRLTTTKKQATPPQSSSSLLFILTRFCTS